MRLLENFKTIAYDLKKFIFKFKAYKTGKVK